MGLPPPFLRLAAVSAGVLLSLSLAAEPAGAGAVQTIAHASKYPFAGYITPPTTVTSATATVSPPSFSCAKKFTAVASGVIVFDPTGSKFSGAEVYVACSAKKEMLAAYVDIDNSFTAPTVIINPGDTVVLSVTCGSSGISVSVNDETTSSSGGRSSSTPETCTQAEVGDDAVVKGGRSGLVPLPAFGMLDFSAVMVNGSTLGSFGPTAANYSEGKKNVITTGALTGGTAFSTTKGP